jgi:RNA polymerase sigma factor (sigma-70 family)
MAFGLSLGGVRKYVSLFYTKPRMGGVCLLVNGAESGNSQWCERLYEAKAGGLILYGRALGLTHSESEDVVHETFVALMRLAEEPRQPEHYCIRAFRNRALNYKRSLWRRVTRELESLRWFEKNEGETPAERAAMRCLAMLPPEQREVIVLKIWSEYTFEEISELLELSPNTVAGRYRYGLQKLRAAMKKEDYERIGLPGNSFAKLAPATPFA